MHYYKDLEGKIEEAYVLAEDSVFLAKDLSEKSRQKLKNRDNFARLKAMEGKAIPTTDPVCILVYKYKGNKQLEANPKELLAKANPI